jgi:(p)ppGpp synthase/HD superfamily hydrolase
MLQKALIMAIKAHEGQLDKGGLPYINHPVYLALQFNNPVEQSVALLHDVLEDSNLYTYDDIKNNISSEVADAVLCLTKKKHEEYFKYLDRVKTNVIATNVKIKDLSHNMDLSRLSSISEKDYKRIDKYKKALAILQENS